MPNNQTLTVKELKTLLRARVNAELVRSTSLQARIQRELGCEVQAEKSEVVAANNKFVELLCDIVAHRLKQNQRATPLLSSGDCDTCITLAISEMEKVKGSKFEDEDRQSIQKIMNTISGGYLELVDAMIPRDTDPYEECWRWVMTVLGLAAERGMPPNELLALESTTDEITRRMFTKERFVALNELSASRIVENVEVLTKKIFTQLAFDLLDLEHSEEERRGLEQKIEAELMPQIRMLAEKTKAVCDTFSREEVERIYSAA